MKDEKAAIDKHTEVKVKKQGLLSMEGCIRHFGTKFDIAMLDELEMMQRNKEKDIE